jgi:hypothetical protein
MVGFSAAIAMPTNDMPPDTVTDMAAPTAATPAARGSTLHNGSLRHRKDEHRS